MPRRRPAAIRATHHAAGRAVPQWAGEGDGPSDRLSPGTTAVVRALEYGGRFSQDPPSMWSLQHVGPGRTAEYLAEYRRFLRQPGDRLRLEASLCPSCPGCQYEDVAVVRDALEAVTLLLPMPAREEMRRLLSRLDDEFRRRTLPDSSPRRGGTGEPLAWWHRRIYRN